MLRWGLRIVSIAVVVASFPSARAWTPATRIRMVDEAVRMMPPSLRLALEHHREELLRGLLEPLTTEDGAAHRPASDDGTLEREIAARMEALDAVVHQGKSFRDIARGFGALAHFVGDAGFPPVAAGPAAAERHADFAKFCESRMERFPLVFYGHEEGDGGARDPRAFAQRILDRSRAEDTDLSRAYAAAGRPPDPAAFDDRSVPFAVGSLAYSRGVTDLVRAWLTAWGGARGDLKGTPYLRSARVYRR